MAKRLAPFRVLDPHDELSHFALGSDYSNVSTTGTGYGDAGVFVTILAGSGNLSVDPVTYGVNNYLGKTNWNGIGFNQYPEISLKVRPASSGDITPLGITLIETAQTDEHGQKLLYDRDKADATQVVLPGESTRIATRGIFTLWSSAIDGTLTPGSSFKLSATSGKITGCLNSDTAALGLVLGTGARGSNGAPFADAYSGVYAQIKLGK